MTNRGEITKGIAKETLNLLNCSEAKIQVRNNLFGFMPSTIEIKDEKRGNIFLTFGDIESKAPLRKFFDKILIKDITILSILFA